MINFNKALHMQIQANFIDVHNSKVFPAEISIRNGKIDFIEKTKKN